MTAGRVAPVPRRSLTGAGVGVVGTALSLAVAALLLSGATAVGNPYGGTSTAFSAATGLAYFGVVGLGTFLVFRRPENPIGWLLAAGGCLFQLDEAMRLGAPFLGTLARGGRDMVIALEDFLWIPGVGVMLVYVGLLFPDGRLLSRRWRWVVVLGAVALVLAYVGNTLTIDPRDYGSPGAMNPLRPEGLTFHVAEVASSAILVLPLFAASAVVALVVRYRRGRPEERQQIRVLLFAMALYASTFPINLVVHLSTGHGVTLLEDLTVLGMILVPAGAAIAVLRYRLYDIEVVISRTLVYGSLALFITAVYVAIVVGIGTLVGSGGRPNILLSIAATGVVAVAFQPLRERLQRVANRVVYGKRATPYETLSQFSIHVAESLGGDEVLPRMAEVLAEATGAERAAVWLRDGDLLRPAAVSPDGAAELGPVAVAEGVATSIAGGDRVVEVRHQGELLGALSVLKRPGEALTPIEEKLMLDLAHQAGLVLKNVGLTAGLVANLAELRASRQRLVAAQDDERRRLERDLHDGAQQNLVALKVKLGLAEMVADKDPARAARLLTELKADTDEALQTLRDLARGIYPPLLADRGLEAALEAQARKLSIPVAIDAGGLGRYPREVESTIYYCALEALQNVAKYAGAAGAAVRVRATNGHLAFTVEDDGGGFDPDVTAKGAGLRNMTDRLEALGGSLEVDSAPGRGTRVSGSLA